MEERSRGQRIAELVTRFENVHFASHPEDASTLGVLGHARRLSSPSRVSALRDRGELALVLSDAAKIEAHPEGTPLDLDAALDLDAVTRAARFHLRHIEQDRAAETLELATLPNSSIQHGALHARSLEDVEALIARAQATPQYLEEHAENLRRGVAEGRGPDRDIAAAFVERILPGAAGALDLVPADVARRLSHVPRVEQSGVLALLAEATRAASDAYRKMVSVVNADVLPSCRPDAVLGHEEVAFRLRDVMGVETPIAQLIASANERLRRAHAEIVEHAALAGHANVRRIDDAADAVMLLFGPKPTTIEEALAAYRKQIDAATVFCGAHAMVAIPDDLKLSLDPLPDGIADGAGFTNWPAPLLDRTASGHALYSKEPAAHPTIMAKQLAIHECIPGHYLQSAIWQRGYGGRASAVRFVGVQDDVAMSLGYFGTMVSVEGWAVWMEEVMVQKGFMEAGRERMFSAWCDAVRATRVLLDLGLHAEGKSADEMASLVARGTLLSEGWARQQVLRSKRIPLQSSTYLIGAMEIEALHQCTRGRMSMLDFHRELLSHGPVPTSRLRRHFEQR